MCVSVLHPTPARALCTEIMVFRVLTSFLPKVFMFAYSRWQSYGGKTASADVGGRTGTSSGLDGQPNTAHPPPSFPPLSPADGSQSARDDRSCGDAATGEKVRWWAGWLRGQSPKIGDGGIRAESKVTGESKGDHSEAHTSAHIDAAASQTEADAADVHTPSTMMTDVDTGAEAVLPPKKLPLSEGRQKN